MPQKKRHHWALIGFVVVTLAGTFPIVLELDSALMGLGDTLLNSWILAWEAHSLFGADQASFFDTNIFYPHRNTLAYSEFLIPQLIVALPVLLSSGNPVLAHNVVLLFSLVTTALGTYLLAFRITASRSAGFVAGLILGFCPFMFSHLVHVQILFAGGIPLTFLFLFRWLEKGRTQDAAALGLLFAVQVLANAYYAVYLAFFGGIVWVVQVLRGRCWTRQRFWMQLAVAAVIATALIGPFYWRYFQLQQDMGFQRVLPPPTPPSAYLAAPGINRLYGEATRPFGGQEGFLFPGFVASLLALTGLYRWTRSTHLDAGAVAVAPRARDSSRWSFLILDGLILICSTLLLLVSLGWSLDSRLGPIHLRIASWRNPLLLLILLIIARLLMHRRWPGQGRPWGLPTSGWTYPGLLLSAFVLSLGTAPYLFLYRWIPGFSSLRAISRIHVIFMFALAVLAAQGAAFLIGRSTGVRRRIVAVVLPLLILCEYFSAPLPVVAAPRPDEFPKVQEWLADQDEDLVSVAYPIRISDNILRLYYSTQHWRRMVNGFSGFIPPLWRELSSRGRFYPDHRTVLDLQELGVDLLLIDTESYRDPRRRRLRASLANLEELEEVGVFDQTLVFRIEPRSTAQPPPGNRQVDWVPLAPASLRLSASVNQGSVGGILDADRRTAWRSPMEPGEWLEISWEEMRIVAGLELDISGYPLAYPRGFRLESSEDGHRWQTVAQVTEFHPPIRGFLQPNDFVFRFRWSATPSRHLRLTQTGESSEHFWAVVEASVLTPPS